MKNRKLTWEQAEEVRLRKRNGDRTRDLALEYGVSKTSINCIARGASYKHSTVDSNVQDILAGIT